MESNNPQIGSIGNTPAVASAHGEASAQQSADQNGPLQHDAAEPTSPAPVDISAQANNGQVVLFQAAHEYAAFNEQINILLQMNRENQARVYQQHQEEAARAHERELKSYKCFEAITQATVEKMDAGNKRLFEFASAVRSDLREALNSTHEVRIPIAAFAQIFGGGFVNPVHVPGAINQGVVGGAVVGGAGFGGTVGYIANDDVAQRTVGDAVGQFDAGRVVDVGITADGADPVASAQGVVRDATGQVVSGQAVLGAGGYANNASDANANTGQRFIGAAALHVHGGQDIGGGGYPANVVAPGGVATGNVGQLAAPNADAQLFRCQYRNVFNAPAANPAHFGSWAFGGDATAQVGAHQFLDGQVYNGQVADGATDNLANVIAAVAQGNIGGYPGPNRVPPVAGGGPIHDRGRGVAARAFNPAGYRRTKQPKPHVEHEGVIIGEGKECDPVTFEFAYYSCIKENCDAKRNTRQALARHYKKAHKE